MRGVRLWRLSLFGRVVSGSWGMFERVRFGERRVDLECGFVKDFVYRFFSV